MSLIRVTATTVALVFLSALPLAAEAQDKRSTDRGNARDRVDDRNDDRDEDRGRGNDARNEKGRTLFTWSGVVDREVILVMQGRDLQVRREGGIFASRDDRDRSDRARSTITGALPRTDGIVRARLLDGRGTVDVVQQPHARNNYTTLLRIRDARSGDDRYRVSASWEPEMRRGREDDRGRDRDDDWGRGDRAGRDDSGLRWSGVIDHETDLRIRARRVEIIDRGNVRTRDARSTFFGSSLSRESGPLRVLAAAGRGTVRITQQPAPWNDYTAIVRVRDPQSGASRYDLDLRW